MLIANIQGLSAHLAELVFHLQATRPHVVLLQETWLDASVECVDIAGYFTVSRKDRSEGPNRGGVLTLARNDFNRLVFIENAEKDERSWHYLHADPRQCPALDCAAENVYIHEGAENRH